MTRSGEVVPIHLTLSGTASICTESGLSPELKAQGKKILLCLAVHAAVSDDWQLSQLDVARCVFSHTVDEDHRRYTDADFEDRRGSFTVAVFELRKALKGSPRDHILYDKGSKKFALNKDLVILDAVEFRKAYDYALTAQEEEDQIELFQSAVNKSQGSLEDLGIECKRFQTEIKKLRDWQFNACYQLALRYENQGKLDKAINYAEQAATIDASNVDTENLKRRVQETINSSVIQLNPGGNLPHRITSFIERKGEMTAVIDLLARNACLTLTGSGGCGKTSLALQVAAAIRNEYPQGVWFVELAALTNLSLTEHVASILAKAIDLREERGTTVTQTLVKYCCSRKLLLVIDNCEHIIQVCAKLIDALLRSCPQIKILATSREALNIGEQTYRVPSLSLPDLKQPQTPETLRSYEASRLFIERATAAKHDFAVTEQNAAAIGQICCRLDGIPFALELAAAHAFTLSVEEIEARLNDRFHLLTDGKCTALPRQQTLRALIDWSYNLLDAKQKMLLNRLSVFAGGWTLEAAEEIGRDERGENPEVYGLLTSLVKKSLVQAETLEAGIRYHLLETIREYAREHLIDDKEEEALAMRHATYFLRVGEESEAGLYGREQQSWLNRIENEYDNFRAALTWCGSAKGEPQIGVRLAGALGRFWWLRGYLAEGRTYIDTFLTLTNKSGAPAERARAMNAAASLAYRAGDIAAAKASYQQSLAIVPKHNADEILCVALRGIGHLEFIDEHVDSALDYMERSLNAARKIGSKKDVVAALEQKGYILFHSGDSNARSLLQECVTLSRESGHSQALSSALYTLGQLEMAEGYYRAAKTLNAEAYEIDQLLKTPAAVAFGVLGTIAMIEGHFPEAQRIFTVQLKQLRAADSPLPLASTLRNAASVELCMKNYTSAASMLAEGLIIVRDKNWQRGMAEFLDSFGCLAAAQGQNERAAQLWGAANAQRSSTRQATAYHERKQREEDMSQVEREIGAPILQDLMAIGYAMSSDNAIAYALQVDSAYL